MNRDWNLPAASRRDVILAVVLFAFAALFLVAGSGLSWGRPGRIGPGYMPWLLSWCMVGLGGAIGLRGLWNARPARVAARAEVPPDPPPAWRGLLWIGLGMLAFALSIRGVGLFGAAFLTALLATFAQREAGWRVRLPFVALLAGGAVLLFSYALGLPVPVLPEIG